ncbi:MAG: translation initiation factor IF-2 [Candidatus Bathyarchaeota archaeon]|nr:translation initiation factor IF-2 [Candidatus Bathyarchaeota archaeon]
MSRFRQPIVCVLGHVDSGKTTLLDNIRGSVVASREVGSMTQHIGASFFPIDTLQEICGSLAQGMVSKIRIEGLLVVDTPGHSIFMNLRRRGGSVADIAILVVDVLRGFEPQTHESLSILKNRKTPFIVAANKIDTIPGWKPHKVTSFSESYQQQDPSVKRQLDELLYIIMGTFSRLGINADRYDKVRDFSKTVAITPVSAKTGEGISELLAILIGLTQQYLEKQLTVTEGSAKGTILEVKKEPGLGTTIDAIIYDGILNRGDTLIIGGVEKPIVTKARAILLPKPLDEMRDPRDKFLPVTEVAAAAGVKISAPNIEDAVAGAPLFSVRTGEPLDPYVQAVSEEIERLRIITDKLGVIVKTDTLGSLEALIGELENHGVAIRIADVGGVSRRDVIEAASIKRVSRFQGVILAFNVPILQDAETEAHIQDIPIFRNDVIYRLIEEYNDWVEIERDTELKMQIESLIFPGKIKVLPGLIFRKSKPAVFGVEIISGKIQSKYNLISKTGKRVGEISQMQDEGETISAAEKSMKIAISVRDGVVARDFNENDILYVDVPERHVKEFLSKYISEILPEDVQTLKELIEIKRQQIPLWAL